MRVLAHCQVSRSEMRYVMRIAKPASHQNFERTLHFLRGICRLPIFIPQIKIKALLSLNYYIKVEEFIEEEYEYCYC